MLECLPETGKREVPEALHMFKKCGSKNTMEDKDSFWVSISKSNRGESHEVPNRSDLPECVLRIAAVTPALDDGNDSRNNEAPCAYFNGALGQNKGNQVYTAEIIETSNVSQVVITMETCEVLTGLQINTSAGLDGMRSMMANPTAGIANRSTSILYQTALKPEKVPGK